MASVKAIQLPSRCDPSEGQECVEHLAIRSQYLWMIAEVGRLRLAGGKGVIVSTRELPGGATGGTARKIAECGGKWPTYVQARAVPGTGALTAFGRSSGLDELTALAVNTATTELVEFVLLPSEGVYARNLGAAAYNLVVFIIDIPPEVCR